MSKPKHLRHTFIATGISFLFVAAILTPPVNEFITGPIFLLPFIILMILGAVLLVATKRAKPPMPLKRWLLLTGASALSFFIAIFLHNAFYALNILAEDLPILPWIFQALEVLFFLIAIPVCPVVFIMSYGMALKYRSQFPVSKK